MSKPLNYVVLTKGVPDFRDGKVVFKEDNTLNRAATPTVMNPNDFLALEAALEAKVKYGGIVNVICMGPPPYKKVLQEAMLRYADRVYLLSDAKFAAADTLATAEAIRLAVEKLGGADVIFAGFKTADGETGQTGPQAAWKLGYSLATHVLKLKLDPEARTFEVTRSIKDEYEFLRGPLPAFLVTDPAFKSEFRTATQRLKLQDYHEETKKRANQFEEFLTTWDAATLGADEWKVGIKGSPTIVEAVDPIPRAPSERTARVVSGNDRKQLQEAIELIMEKRA